MQTPYPPALGVPSALSARITSRGGDAKDSLPVSPAYSPRLCVT